MITTFEKCLKIYNENPDFFIYKKGVVHGETLHLFSYNSTEHQLFFETSDTITALQMRGIVFKGETHPKLFSLGFQKFFNYGEFEESIDWIKNKKVKQITEKVDGSLILCGLFDDGELFLHTKGILENDYSELAYSVITEKQKEMAISLLKEGWFPIFELVGPKLTQLGSLTIKYEKDELVFLGARNINGDYLSYEEIKELAKKYETRIPNIYVDNSLEDILKLAKVDEEHEGVVFMFEDNSMMKVKFDFYLQQNFFGTKSDKNMLKIVLDAKINGTFDDLISMNSTENNNDLHNFIVKANEYIEEEKMKILNEILEKVKEGFYDEVKEFAFKYQGYKYFGLLMRTKRNGKIEYSEIYDFLRKDGEFLQGVENI